MGERAGRTAATPAGLLRLPRQRRPVLGGAGTSGTTYLPRATTESRRRGPCRSRRHEAAPARRHASAAVAHPYEARISSRRQERLSAATIPTAPRKHMLARPRTRSCRPCHAEKRGPFLWEPAPSARDARSAMTPTGRASGRAGEQRPVLCKRPSQSADRALCYLSNNGGAGTARRGPEQACRGHRAVNGKHPRASTGALECVETVGAVLGSGWTVPAGTA